MNIKVIIEIDNCDHGVLQNFIANAVAVAAEPQPVQVTAPAVVSSTTAKIQPPKPTEVAPTAKAMKAVVDVAKAAEVKEKAVEEATKAKKPEAPSTTAEAPKAKAPKAKPVEVTGGDAITLETLRVKLRTKMGAKAENRGLIRDKLVSLGANSISNLKPEHFADMDNFFDTL